MCVRHGRGVLLVMSMSGLAVRIHREFSKSGAGGGEMPRSSHKCPSVTNIPATFLDPSGEPNKDQFSYFLPSIENKT